MLNLPLLMARVRYYLSSSNEVSGSAQFQIIKLSAVRRSQPITIGKNFFNNPCPIATMVIWQTTSRNPVGY